MATETPEYDVERSDGSIEIRRYESMIVAEITVDGSRREASNRAFTPLANYIFARERGDGGEAIDMTAPVTQSAVGKDRWTVQFIMPAHCTLETLPAPGRDDIRLKTVPPRRVAAIRFSGHPKDENVALHEAELRAWMSENGLGPAGHPVYAYYDAPFKPGILRRNEVMIPIDPD